MLKKSILTILLSVLMPSSLFASEVVNVYSHRHYEADKILFKAFEEETGIKVNVVTAKADELIERIKLEGKNSPADLFIAADIANLYQAKTDGILKPIESDSLTKIIPSNLRDKDGYWYGFTKRARILVYNKNNVDPKKLSTYEAIAEKDFPYKIAVRPSANSYNQSLLASIIANDGEKNAEKWASGVVSNMAREPKGSDRDQIRLVASGDADIAIVNTYYLAIMLNSEDKTDVKLAKQVGVFFPNQQDRGTHINISGGGVVKYAKNEKNAIKLLEFLVTPKAQAIFADANYEYPVNKDSKVNKTIKSWGHFKEDSLNLELVGKYNKQAVKLFNKVNWK